MGNFYDDARFGVIERKWFGLSKNAGGDAAAGFTFGTTDATKIIHVKRWYPKGPIKILKVGHQVIATISSDGTDPDQVNAEVLTRGGSASVAATWNVFHASAPWAIGSKASLTVDQVKAGEYITISTATPSTDNGTAVNTATLTGTVAFFLDYVRVYDQSGKWDT